MSLLIEQLPLKIEPGIFYCCTTIKERELESEVIFVLAFLVGLSSRPDVFCEKVLLEISLKSQGNTLPEFLF